MCSSLELYVNADEAYANQDWKLKIESETSQKKMFRHKFWNTSKKLPPSTANECLHKVDQMWSHAHVNLKKYYLDDEDVLR